MATQIQALKQFGLSEKESKVYLAALELGESGAAEIALKSNLPRTLVYDILEKLIDLGLISYTLKVHKKSFTASAPEKILSIMREKQETIKKILPELKQLQKSGGHPRPKVQIYEGKEGMKSVMDNILNSGVKEFLAYGSSRSSFEVIPAFIEEWHQERIRRKVMMRVLYNDTQESRKKVKTYPDSLQYAHYRFMPITLESPTATIIYADKVVLQSWTKEPFAVAITNKEMADNQRKYFKELWKIAKR